MYVAWIRIEHYFGNHLTLYEISTSASLLVISKDFINSIILIVRIILVSKVTVKTYLDMEVY